MHTITYGAYGHYYPRNAVVQNVYGQSGHPMIPYKSLQEALALVKEAVAGEREDELFYDDLISLAPTKSEKEIIAGIRDDERRHNRMFRRIYEDFTGQTVETPSEVSYEKPRSYVEGLQRAFFGELQAVEKYRDIRAGLPTRYYRDMVFEILTDEMRHADLYNYLLNLDLRRKPHR